MITKRVRIAGAALLLAFPGTSGAVQVPGGDSTEQLKIATTWLPARTSTSAPLRRTIALDLKNASVKVALREIGRRGTIQIAYGEDVTHAAARVTLQGTDLTVREALVAALEGTGLEAFVSLTGHTVLVRRAITSEAGGTVAGRVTDARTGHGVPGARVSLQGASLGTVTNDSGGFRIANVPAGSYTLTVRRIGYVQGTQAITVPADQEVAVQVRLEVSASPLDAVVVTGTITPTEQKAVPNPITVVSGEDMQQRGIRQINDLFHGDIPGVFSADYGASGVALGAPVYVRGTTELFDLPALKTYIDGVEIANSVFLNEIDPAMIDHVEIVRGPEASTMYGAQAINGVMQVFTKKGALATAPHLTASTGVGSLEGPNGTGVRSDNNVSVSGGTAHFSYNVGGSYQHDGPWTPGYSRNVYSGYAGLSIRRAGSPLSVDVSARMGQQNTRVGRPVVVSRAMLDGTLQLDPGQVVPAFNAFALPQRTLGVTVHYTTRSWWQQTLTLGLDRGANGNNSVVQPAFVTPSDSFGLVFSTQTTRATVSYNSALDLRLSDQVAANVIVGADYWNYHDDSYTDQRAVRIADRQRDHNTGLFTQARVGVADALFLTAGVRVDEGPDLPTDRHHRSTNPRLGASYALGAGSVRAKLRAEYGSALKPADPGLKAAAMFTPTYVQLASPNLLPERQIGWDGGVDLYAGDRASLSVTRYDQVARDLIWINFVAFSPVFEQQFVNVARVRNSGWELEGTLHLAAGLSAHATYSETQSVVQALEPNDQTGFTVGQALPGVPHHSGALTIGERVARLSVEATGSYVGTSSNYDVTYLFAAPRLGTPNFGFVTLPAAYRLGLRGGYDLTPRLTLWARCENLLNEITVDQGFLPVDQVGRAVIAGVRVH